ncbi:hypothetical protein ACFSHT_17820 [Paraburkholderia silviterrae]|uniref:DUF7673 domain-containing protein n=1 Tax=Paraburkholderia silviterrae TaxID=2528715 RepID=A0A4R5M9S0_9BURK|nr:hypothetical protein [Paraburkholderia silviterrae]TDG22727.1 hypothetical protein EYW47_16015 [Paraburkholderia silviterrae]
MRPDQMLEGEKRALEKLLKIASGDTEQSRKVADFLLAWWNAGKCGGYDLTTAWGVDDEIVEDMVTVFRLASRAHSYPGTLGYDEPFEALVRDWHPELVPDD